MGRRKIEIEPLTDDRNRTVTFVKRKAGLFKKAHELAVLCQVDLAVVIIGNNNKVYEFSLVDMSEILGFYESHIVGAKPNGGGKARPQESKSPENYGNYRKKRRLSEQLLKRDGSVVKAASQPAGEHAAHDSDSESESATPPRKRVKTEDFPTFNQPYKNEGGPVHKREDSSSSHRPVLRVQIPGEGAAPSAAIAATTTIGGGVSNSRDSARTITAIDNSPRILGGGSSLGSDSQAGNQGGGVQGLVQVPQLQLHTVTPAPPGPAPMTNSIRVPSINKPTNFMSFRDGTGNGDRKPTLPLPIQLKSQTSSPALATGPQLPQQSNMFLMQSPPANAYQSGLLPTPVMNQVFNPYSQNGPNTGNNSAGDHPKRPALFTNIPYSGDTPILGLPSKFVNDMFPSPLTFYAPQDWSDQRGMQMQNPNHNPNLQGQQNQQVQQPGNTGMTPIHGIPLYFMGMMPSGITPTTGAQMGMPSGGGNKPGQNRELPSPIHFMSGGSFTGKK